MADKATTFRTREYKRAVPYGTMTPEALQQIAMASEKVKPVTDEFGRVVKTMDPWADESRMTVEQLLADYPFMDELAQKMVEARLSLYNKYERGKGDKAKGWAERKGYKPNPYSQWVQSADNKMFLTDIGDDWAAGDPDREQMLKDMYTSYEKNPQYGIYFEESTRDDAEKTGGHWYRTMNEYSDALLNDLGREYSRALQDLLNRKMNQIIREDLEKDNPQYLTAMQRKLFPEYDYSQGRPTIDEFLLAQQRKQNRGERTEFERPHKAKTAISSAVAPMWSAVHYDPELEYKTSDLEAGGRLVGDVALMGVNAAVPIAAGKYAGQAVSKTVPYFRNLAGTGAAFGAGGATSAALLGGERALDSALEATTGKGYHLYPQTLEDYGIAFMLGGASAVPWRRAVPKYKDIRHAIDPKQPEAVSNVDVRDMLAAQRAATAKTKEFKGRSGAEGVKKEYLDIPYRPYREKYGETSVFEHQQPPKVKPKESESEYFDRNMEYFTDNLGRPIPYEERKAVWKAAKSKDDDLRSNFTGKKVILPDEEYRALSRIYGGNVLYEGDTPMKNTGLHWILRNKSELGEMTDGQFKKAGPEQKSLYETAKKTATKRHKHVVPNEKRLFGLQKPTKLDVAGEITTPVLGAIHHNVVPFSNAALGVQPYTYEAYPDKKER